MRGAYDFDPMENLEKGQTVAEVVAAARNAKAPPRKIKKPMAEDRKTFLRMMGLGKWIK